MFRTLSATLLATAFAGSALAADLPTRKEPPAPLPPPPTFSWAGGYVGLYAGGSVSGVNSVNALDGQSVKAHPDGVALGGLAGYNLQFQQFVFGIEGEAGWTSRSDTVNYTSISTGAVNSLKAESDYDARVRGRAGYAFGNILPFVAGGVSFTNNKLTLTGITPPGTVASMSKDLVGWNIGAGVDWAFSPNWVARVEYIHDDFGKTLYGFSAPTAGHWQNRNATLTDDTGRVALIYKF